MLAVEEEPEDQLVLGQHLSGNDDGERPLDLIRRAGELSDGRRARARGERGEEGGPCK